MKINVENIPANSLVYMRNTGAYGEQNFKLMQKMKDWVKKQGLWNECGTIYGIAQDNPSFTPSEQCRYDVCFVTEQTFCDDSVHKGALPDGTYLVCEILHTTEDVQHFWSALGSVLAERGKQLDQSRPILERYQFVLV